MLKFPFRATLRFSAAVGLTVAISLTASAQQVGTGVDAAADTGQAGTGDAGSFGVLDADAIFSGIDRGDAVGSTSTTGTGFSLADEAGGTGRATTGGIGGIGAGGFGGLGGFGNLFGLGGAGTCLVTSTIRTPPANRLETFLPNFSHMPAVRSQKGVSDGG